MSGRGGSQTPMLRLDRDTAERLLSGRVAPDDAPPGYAGVARVLSALGAPASDAELRHVDEAVAAAVRIATAEAPPAHAARRAGRSWTARVKLVVLAVFGAMIVTSGLAAAGVLPDAAQNVVSEVLTKVGIRVPHADDRRTTDESEGGTEDGPGSQELPPAVVPAVPAVPDVPDVPGSVDLVRPSAPPTDPPSTSPNGSGTGRANEASGGKSEQGTTNADEKSDGHSAAGSGNSDGHRGGPTADRGNGPPTDRGNGPPADRGNGPPPRGEHGGPPHANRP